MIVPVRAGVNVLKTIAQAIAAIVLTLAAFIGACALWWYAPVRVDGKNIVKATGADNDGRDCTSFKMTPEQFRTWWKDARPIFDGELHDYGYSPCQFKTTENNKEYRVGEFGMGSVTEGDTVYYYVHKTAKSDFEDMP